MIRLALHNLATTLVLLSVANGVLATCRGDASMNYANRNLPTGARRHPTNSRAVNGVRFAPHVAGICIDRNSPQPPQNSFGHSADVLKFRAFAQHPDLRAMTGGEQGLVPRSPPFFFPQVNNVHSASPAQHFAPVSVEKTEMNVCPKELVTLDDGEIDAARKDHERLLVRLMVSPGDSEGAMHRAEQAFGLSYWCQHNLRHKRRASAAFANRVHAAWRAVLEQSVQRDMEELLKLETSRESA